MKRTRRTAMGGRRPTDEEHPDELFRLAHAVKFESTARSTAPWRYYPGDGTVEAGRTSQRWRHHRVRRFHVPVRNFPSGGPGGTMSELALSSNPTRDARPLTCLCDAADPFCIFPQRTYPEVLIVNQCLFRNSLRSYNEKGNYVAR